jgi:hypothetical protein
VKDGVDALADFIGWNGSAEKESAGDILEGAGDILGGIGDLFS